MSLVDQIEELFSQRMLVEMEPSSPELAGPIVAPDRAMPGSQIGTIRKLAADAPTHLHEGLRVIVSQYAGMDLNLEGEVGEKTTFKLCVPNDVIMRLAQRGSKQQYMETPDDSS